MVALLTKSTMPIVKWVAEVMGWLMNGIYSIGVTNLGLCIILFTIIIYMFMTPLQIKQQKFSKMNAVMSPELQKINKKYKGKKDQNSQMKMQEETMDVYEKYGVSPTGSCLQMVIQMTIFFALYQVIIKMPGYIGGIKHMFDSAVVKITNVDGYVGIITEFIKEHGIRSYSWPTNGKGVNDNHVIDFLYSLSPSQWADLGDVDKFSGFAQTLSDTAGKIHPMQNFLGLNIADTPLSLIKTGWSEHTYLLIVAAIMIPLLSWLTQMLNLKLMPTAATDDTNSQMNATMKGMNTFMPLFSAFICFSFPVGIGIYWIAGSVIRCVQQLVINRHLDNMNMDDFIKKNQEKMAKKRAKAGLPPQKITQQAKMNVRNIEEPKKTTAEDRNAAVQKSTEYYKNVQNAKPGSLASKANMVAQFDQKNKSKKK